MEIQIVKHSYFNYIVIDNFYTAQELKEIKKEIKILNIIAQHPDIAHTAHDENGNIKKSGRVTYLDHYYANNRNESAILKYGRKLYNAVIYNKIESEDVAFKQIRLSEADSTIVNFYGNNQEYKEHEDATSLTCVTFLGIGKFIGGNFYFPEINKQIEYKENRTVIFPGCAKHLAQPIKAEPNNYRVSITNLLYPVIPKYI